MAPQTGRILIKITLPFLFAAPPPFDAASRRVGSLPRPRPAGEEARKKGERRRGEKKEAEGMNKANQPVTPSSVPFFLVLRFSSAFPSRCLSASPLRTERQRERRRNEERAEGVERPKWGERVTGVVWLPLGNLNESRGYPLNAKIRSGKISFFHPD